MEIRGDSSALFALLQSLQQEMPVIPKTSTNPHFKSKYADLPTIMDILSPLLQKHQILLMQPIYASTEPNMLTIGTMLVDGKTGSSLEVVSTVPIGNNLTPQAFGSAVTYARRYVLCSLLGIVADEDDDGNASSVQQGKPGKIGQSQIVRLYTIAKASGYTQDDVLEILKKKHIHAVKDLTEETYEKFCNWLTKNPKAGSDE